MTDPASVAARFVEYRRTQSRALRNELVEEHMGLVSHFVRRYRYRGVAEDDLRQVCLLAVVRATERFDPAMGVAFATFASRTIEGDLKRYLRDRTWALRPPRRAQELYLEVRRAEDDLAQTLGRAPDVEQIAAFVGESVDRVLEALEAGAAHRSISLDVGALSFDDDYDRPDRALGGPEPAYDDVEARDLIAGLLDDLSQRDREIVEMRFFANMTQPQIAERIGVSQSYLSRLLRGILVDLRSRLERDP